MRIWQVRPVWTLFIFFKQLNISALYLVRENNIRCPVAGSKSAIIDDVQHCILSHTEGQFSLLTGLQPWRLETISRLMPSAQCISCLTPLVMSHCSGRLLWCFGMPGCRYISIDEWWQIIYHFSAVLRFLALDLNEVFMTVSCWAVDKWRNPWRHNIEQRSVVSIELCIKWRKCVLHNDSNTNLMDAFHVLAAQLSCRLMHLWHHQQPIVTSLEEC